MSESKETEQTEQATFAEQIEARFNDAKEGLKTIEDQIAQTESQLERLKTARNETTGILAGLQQAYQILKPEGSAKE